MPTLADTDVEINLAELESLIDDVRPRCDNDGCENEATHTLTCGTCKVGTEFSCLACLIIMKEGARQGLWDGIIRFDAKKSCGHLSHINDCIINPL